MKQIEKELIPLLIVIMRMPLEFNPNKVIIAKHLEQHSGFKHIPTAKIVVKLKIPNVKITPPKEFKKKIISYRKKYSLLSSKDKETLELAIKFLNKGASSKNLDERVLNNFMSLDLIAPRLINKRITG